MRPSFFFFSFFKVIDNTEHMFKLFLLKGQVNDILIIIQTSRLVGQSIIGHLQRKGYPEIALQFVDDKKTRFALAFECGVSRMRSVGTGWGKQH